MDKKLQKLLDSNKVKYKIIPHRKVYTAFTEAETQRVDPRTVVKTVFIKLSKPTTHAVGDFPPLMRGGIKGEVVVQTIDSLLVAVPAKSRVDFKKIAKAVNDHAQKSYVSIQKQAVAQARGLPKSKSKKQGIRFRQGYGGQAALHYSKPTAVTAKMASEKDITNKLKTKIGLLHPFGILFNIPLLLDKKLGKNKKVIVPAGSYTESLEMSYKDILKITPGMGGSFTE